MKSINYIILLVLALSIFFVGCKKNYITEVTPPEPGLQKINSPVLSGSYFIQNDPSSEYKIPLGITTLSNSDRTIQITYTSSTGATQGVQYTAPTSVTIPAGKAWDTLRVKGIFAGYPGSRKDVLKIKLTGGNQSNWIGKDSFLLNMQKYCDVVLADLGGAYELNEYDASGNFSYGPYGGGVVNLTSTGATTASGQFVNLYDYGWNDINFTMDWTDPANFKITIPVQATGGGGYPYIRGTANKSSFSSCDQTFSIALDLMTDATTVDYSGYQIRLKR